MCVFVFNSHQDTPLGPTGASWRRWICSPQGLTRFVFLVTSVSSAFVLNCFHNNTLLMWEDFKNGFWHAAGSMALVPRDLIGLVACARLSAGSTALVPCDLIGLVACTRLSAGRKALVPYDLIGLVACARLSAGSTALVPRDLIGLVACTRLSAGSKALVPHDLIGLVACTQLSAGNMSLVPHYMVRDIMGTIKKLWIIKNKLPTGLRCLFN